MQRTLNAPLRNLNLIYPEGPKEPLKGFRQSGDKGKPLHYGRSPVAIGEVGSEPGE